MGIQANNGVDLVVANHGSIIQLIPVSEAGQEWIDEYVDVPDWCSNRCVAVEPRFAGDIIEGAMNDGLEIDSQ